MESSLIPARLSNKPLRIVEHMPWHVKKQIVQFARAEVKMQLRGCSKEFKKLVDNSFILYKEINFWMYKGDISVGRRLFDKDLESIEFHETENGCLMWNRYNDWSKLLPNTNADTAAIDFFFKHLTNPRFGVEVIDTLMYFDEFGEETLDYFKEKLEAMHKRIPVHEITGNSQSLYRLIPYLEPGKLKKIHFEDKPPSFRYNRFEEV